MFLPTLRELKNKIMQLQERWRRARRVNEQLRQEIEQLRRQKQQLEREREQLEQQRERLERERERLREENDRLRRQLEEAQRANKRQAAPSPGARGKSIRKLRDVSQVPLMANGITNSLPSRWMKSSACPCPSGVAAEDG